MTNWCLSRWHLSDRFICELWCVHCEWGFHYIFIAESADRKCTERVECWVLCCENVIMWMFADQSLKESTKAAAPAFTFAGKHQQKVRNDAPSPNTYNTAGLTSRGKHNQPPPTIYSFGFLEAPFSPKLLFTSWFSIKVVVKFEEFLI